MPDHPILKPVLSLVESGDDSKVLHITFGDRKLKAGEQIAKGGQMAHESGDSTVSL